MGPNLVVRCQLVNKLDYPRIYPAFLRLPVWIDPELSYHSAVKARATGKESEFFSDYSKSNPLPKPDLTAFPTGYPVWNVSGSHKIRNDWKEVERDEGGSLIIGPAGNSFSGPHAAGVAALMLSVNPELNPWVISTILRETASDLGPTGTDYKFGAGLIDALAAVRELRKETRFSGG